VQYKTTNKYDVLVLPPGKCTISKESPHLVSRCLPVKRSTCFPYLSLVVSLVRVLVYLLRYSMLQPAVTWCHVERRSIQCVLVTLLLYLLAYLNRSTNMLSIHHIFLTNLQSTYDITLLLVCYTIWTVGWECPVGLRSAILIFLPKAVLKEGHAPQILSCSR
jgi:hypothetical protein